MGKSKENSKYQGLFNLLHNQYGLILLESEMQDIINEVDKIRSSVQEQYDDTLLNMLGKEDRNYSQSPDTLREGDWCKFGSESQALENSKHWIIIPEFLNLAIKDAMKIGVQFNNGVIYIAHDKDRKTQLTPEEFIRRAENTFSHDK